MPATESAAPERVDLASLDIAAERVARLREDFPDVFREDRIDFDALKSALGEWVDPGKERFGLTWPGKANCMRVVQQPSVGTLVPDRAESIDFDTTQNVIIEGENLEVLKLLQKSYYGKVKMIYIDPPYNTGNEFIYSDNFAEPLAAYLRLSGQTNGEGQRLTTNTETEGRYHSNWLNMMYPRLYLARNLLRDDGVIFVSIDDREVANLRLLMNEIFGEENFVSDVTVVNNLKGRSDRRYIATANERLLMYVKSYEFEDQGLPLPAHRLSEFSDEDGRGVFRLLGLRKRGGADTRQARPNLCFPLFVNPADSTVQTCRTSQHSIEVLPMKSDGSDGCWRWGRSTVQSRLGELIGRPVGAGGRYDVFEKDYLEEDDGTLRRIKPKSVMAGANYSTDAATKAFKALMPEVEFTNPKPVPMLADLVEYSTQDNSTDIVLDFFAGSGSMGHAVFELLATIGGQRRFILAQLPEPTHDASFSTISSIARERLRRAGRAIEAERAKRLDLDGTQSVDLGFRAYHLTESNFLPWSGGALDDRSVEQQIALFADNLVPDRTREDILTEILLKAGFELTVPVERLRLAGKDVFSVDDGALLVCLERPLTIDVIEAMAARDPAQIVCLDSGFAGNDGLKVNAVQTVKARPNTVFKVV